MLCGVMRIALVAKGLLIKEDMDLELVLMVRDKPTQTLLDTVCQHLPLQIEVRGTHTHADWIAHLHTHTHRLDCTSRGDRKSTRLNSSH